MSTSMMSRALTLCCLVAPAFGMQGLMTASRPALRASCTADRRCAPLCALHGDDEESRIDIDDLGDECFITNAGASCIGADDSSIDMADGLDAEPPPPQMPLNAEGRQRSSPGMTTNFVSSSTEDFKKPYVPPSEVAEPAVNRLDREPHQQSSQSDERGQRRYPGLMNNFLSSSTEDFKKRSVPVAEPAMAGVRGSVRGTSGRSPASFPVFSSRMPSYISVPSSR